MINKTKTAMHKDLNVIYVFSENNKVYIKNTTDNAITNEEWLAVNFH